MIPEVGGVLVFTGLSGGGWVIFYEPSKVLGIVNFVRKHLFAALSEDGF